VKEFLSLVGTDFIYYELHVKFVFMDIHVFKIHVCTVNPLQKRKEGNRRERKKERKKGRKKGALYSHYL